MRELFAGAADVATEELAKTEERILSALSDALSERRTDRSDRVRRAGQPSARELAEHLYVVSYGLQQRGHSGQTYRARMATAVRIVCTSGS